MQNTIKTRLESLYSKPVLLLTLTALFWAGNAIAGQLAVGKVSPFALTFLRWILVVCFLWPFYGSKVRAQWSEIRPRLKMTILSAMLGYTGFNALFYVASHYTTAVNIGIIQGSIPVFVMMGAFLAFRTPVSVAQALGVALTISGVVTVATGGHPLQIFSISINTGDLFMLMACALYSAYTVTLRVRPSIDGLTFFTFLALVAAVAAAPLAALETFRGDGIWPVSISGIAVTLYIAAFPSCLGQIFFMRGVDLIGPGKAGVFVNLVPVFAAALAVAILGQPFHLHHALALALVMGGIWMTQRKPRSKRIA